jgi:carbon-monoxide dehydrogenase large subunit
VHGPAGSVGFTEIAYAANVRQEHLPTGMEPLLDMTGTYEPSETGGVFAYGTHAVVVAVEPDTGVVEILDYAVSEDCGTMINPMIVDGQVQGGVAHGIGNAMFEFMKYDDDANPLTTTFQDYLLPASCDVPGVVIEHIETPNPLNPLGVKGAGEGGTIPAPAAIIAAIEDALSPFGVHFTDMPLTPDRIVAALHAAGAYAKLSAA